MALFVLGHPQRQQSRQLANQFNGQLAIFWDQPDLGQQRANDAGGFGFGGAISESVAQVGNLIPVDVSQIGVKQNRWALISVGQFRLQFCLAGFQRVHLGLHTRMKHSLGNGLDDLVDLLGDLC
ncbi:hypothetical protein [Shimia gijangensis]|uniref:hypothetical protein n=1 Tax=Shimia gijangensis TaxID=1470563 RepID=UPI001FE3ED12|nr:hypothetical protein [Shimia gijangensis]